MVFSTIKINSRDLNGLVHMMVMMSAIQVKSHNMLNSILVN